MNDDNKISKYLQYLPGIYQTEEIDASPGFLGRFLMAFENILSGIDVKEQGSPIKGIEEILDRIHDYIDPYKTPAEFVEWLAGWVALTLQKGKAWKGEDADPEDKLQNIPLDEERKTRNRNLIRLLVPIYHKRGTREGMEEALKIYMGEEAKEISINELINPFQIGDTGYLKEVVETELDKEIAEVSVKDLIYLGNKGKLTSVVGSSTVVGEGYPYYFRVYMTLPEPHAPVFVMKKKQIIMDIINNEKPAHTYYTLTIEVPAMKIGEYCTVGVDTLVGGLKL
ncbi:MAG: phage tail protein [Nitrospinota bacterium]